MKSRRGGEVVTPPGPNPPWYPKMRPVRFLWLHAVVDSFDSWLNHPFFFGDIWLCRLVTAEFWGWETYAYGNLWEENPALHPPTPAKEE